MSDSLDDGNAGDLQPQSEIKPSQIFQADTTGHESREYFGQYFEATISSPYLPPELLRQYEALVPGSAARSMDMVEAEQKQTHKLQNEESERQTFQIRSEDAIKKRGQIFAFILMIVFAGFGIVMTCLGQPTIGLPTILLSAAVLVGIFMGSGWLEVKKIAEMRKLFGEEADEE